MTIWHLTELERRCSIQYHRIVIATEILKLLLRGDEIPVYSYGDLVFQGGESCRAWINEVSQFECDIIAEKPDARQEVFKAAVVYDAMLNAIVTDLESAAGVLFAQVRNEVQSRCPETMIASNGPGLRHALNQRWLAWGRP